MTVHTMTRKPISVRNAIVLLIAATSSTTTTTSAFTPHRFVTTTTYSRKSQSSLIFQEALEKKTKSKFELYSMLNGDNEVPTTTVTAAVNDSKDNDELNRELQKILSSTTTTTTMKSNNDDNKPKPVALGKAVRFLKEHMSMELSKESWDLIFDAIEERTANAEENTSENLRAAAEAAATSFPLQSQARQEMTDMYTILKQMNQLKVYGSASTADPQYEYHRQLPAAGSYSVPPSLLEEILDMPMTALTPQPTNTVLLAGVVFAILEGIVSVMTGVSLNALVLTTLLLAFLDRLFLNGAVLETTLKLFNPGVQQKVTRHEAGHFLVAYLLGCPVEGIVLSAWAALQDKRFGNRAVTAGTSFFDPQLSQQMNNQARLTRSSVDRYSIIVMAGIAAEADQYGRADGGAGDEMALVGFLANLGSNKWNADTIRNQARWGALQATLLLREYKPAYDALVDALERGGTLKDCVYAIEKAARDHNLPPVQEPIGYIVEESQQLELKTIWTKENPMKQKIIDQELQQKQQQQQQQQMQQASNTSASREFDNEAAKQSLKEYREEIERKLQDVENKLKELQD